MKITTALRREIKKALALGRIDEPDSPGDPAQLAPKATAMSIDLLYFTRVLAGERNLSMSMFEKMCKSAGREVAMSPPASS